MSCSRIAPWFLLALAATTASADDSCFVEADDLLAIEAPAVLVLGERPGTQPDLTRAARIVRGLARQGPVTLGLQVVPSASQATLDAFQAGDLPLEDIPSAMSWASPWPWTAYRGLVSLGSRDAIELVALGPDESPPPAAGGDLPLPSDYADWLFSDGDAMPEPLQSRIARQMAWTDYRIAERAIFGWGGEGYLVLLVDRTRVDSARGVAWQARRLTGEAVHDAALAWGAADCGESRIWKAGWLRLDLPSLGFR